MAVASLWLGARYNRDGFTLFDFDVYAQAGDGCMMEGVASERPRTPRTSASRTSAGSTTRTG
jgi:transketolase